jgi:hypothetical protein
VGKDACFTKNGVLTNFDLRAVRQSELSAKTGGGANAGLMGIEENMEPFPSLPTVLGNPAKNAGLPHSHRTTITIEFGQFYFVATETNQLCSNTIAEFVIRPE